MQTAGQHDYYGEASYCAFLYDDMEYYQAVIGLIERKIAAGSANTHHHNNLGVLHWEIGQSGEAIECFSEAIRLNAKNAHAFKNRGMLKEKTGKLEAALNDFAKAVAIDPENYSLNLNNAYMLLKLERATEAVDFFEKAIRLGFNNEIVSGHLATAYRKSANPEMAAHYEKQALELAKQN